MNKNERFEQVLFSAACGRSPNEQIDYMDHYGSHGLPEVLRAFVLLDSGVPQSALTAENAVIMGCYPPFMDSRRMLAYFKLLEALGVSHTYLKKEYCCGVPLLRGPIKDDEREKFIEVSRGYIRKNLEEAGLKGATTLAYYCIGCAHAVKFLAPEEAHRHVYALDLVMPALEKRRLKLSPTKAAYFEGCHTRYEALCGNVSLNWPAYRRALDHVEGLSIVDLPNDVCCTKKQEQILKQAREQGVETLITACSGCAGSLGMAAGEDLAVKHLSEVLLEAL